MLLNTSGKQLKDIDDISLSERVKNTGDEAALLELCDRHTGLCVDILRRFYRKEYGMQDYRDLLESTASNIYEATLKFDKTRGVAFPTFLAETIKWKCLSRTAKMMKTTLLEFDVSTFDFADRRYLEPDKLISSKESINDVEDYFNNHPDKRIAEIFKLRMVDIPGSTRRMSWVKVGQKIGVSYEKARQMFKTALREYRKNYEQNECQLCD